LLLLYRPCYAGPIGAISVGVFSKYICHLITIYTLITPLTYTSIN
jgi:hypothetical protein